MSQPVGRPLEGSGAVVRLPEIDFLKAAGIVLIPLIHSMRALWDGSVSSAERWVLFVTRFAVPGFLFASGYLVAGERVSAPRVGARLRRLIVPYVVATAVAEAFFVVHGRSVTVESVAVDLLFGSALGPYYYVFVASLLILAWPLFAVARPAVLWGLAATSVACQLLVELGKVRLPIPWVIRNPFLWSGYFLYGWGLRRERGRVLDWLEPRRTTVAGILVFFWFAAVACAAWLRPSAVLYVIVWLNVYVTIALSFVFSTNVRSVPDSVRLLSDVSYAVYLYHLLVIYSVWDPDHGAPAAFGPASAAASWALGVVVPVAAALVLRRAIGARARLLFGG